MKEKLTERREAMREHCLEIIEQSLADFDPYETERYSGDASTVPDGPWNVGSKEPISPKIKDNLSDYGCHFDDECKPIHPWIDGLLKTTGVATGTGQYWNWGPNYTADPIVIANLDDPQLLLIKRRNNLKWALPGGFLEHGDDAEMTARKEAKQESDLTLPVYEGLVVYDGIVADERTTAHAWAHTTALLWILDETVDVVGGDDALDAQWFDVKELPKPLHGSHQKLIEFALQDIGL